MKEEMLFLSRQCHGNLRRPKVLTLDLILKNKNQDTIEFAKLNNFLP